MKKTMIAAITLLAGICTEVKAQSNNQFDQFLRTKDSLMHIAFYDRNIPAYKKSFDEVKPAYNKLGAKEQVQYKPYIDEEYYYLSRAYALAGDKNNALAMLELAGNQNYADLKGEADLNNLRKEPRFVKLLAVAKNRKSDKLETLQRDAQYNEHEHSNLPVFTYQAAGDANLSELRTSFNLDSVAGEGNDVSQIINLMEWVHYLVPHNGAKGNPQVKNAMNMITECRRDKKTLNCRGLATVLNEVYLAEGFKSRFVTCMPKDTADNDCHVINVVWAPSLKKWLWMDPTFMAYIMNEDGELLSIEEVRNRLVNDKPLLLNPDANRNHETTQTKQDYLGYYMAKNLYKLECPINSEYNYETRAEGKARAYIQLVPGNTPPQTKSDHNAHGVSLYTMYYTNNPKTFWAAPEDVTKMANAGTQLHSQSDYEAIMSKLKIAYNEQQPNCMSGIVEDKELSFWNDQTIAKIKEDYGNILSYKYLGLEANNKDQEIALFKVAYNDKPARCMAISLEKDNKIGTFRFSTTSNYIDWVMAKATDKEKGSN